MFLDWQDILMQVPGGLGMKSSVTQRFKTFVNRHSNAMTIIGALIVFVTFVVKEAIGDNLREYVQSLHEAQSVFVLRQDHSVLEREVRGLRQEVQALHPAVQQQDRQKLQFVRESQDFEQSEKDYIVAGGSFIEGSIRQSVIETAADISSSVHVSVVGLTQKYRRTQAFALLVPLQQGAQILRNDGPSGGF
jgi:hypothetical protein